MRWVKSSAKSYPGKLAIEVQARPAEPSQARDRDARRGQGSVYGALWETTGDCWTQCYPRRCSEHFIDLLCYVDEQVEASTERIYALMENLERHHCRDLLVFMRHHERWEASLSADLCRLLESD